VSPEIRLTPRARADLDGITRYSAQRWGADQTRRYVGSILKRFDWLAQNPLLGRLRPDLAPDLRVFPEGAHLIFYRHKADAIEIIAVVHRAMDVDALSFEAP